MPAPPPELTAAAGALVTTARSSRRALTTAMLDLASRGELAFEQEDKLALQQGLAAHARHRPAADEDAARRRLNARRPHQRGRGVRPDASSATCPTARTSSPTTTCSSSASKVADFDDKLEDVRRPAELVQRGPGQGIGRWSGRGVLEIVGGVIALVRRIPDPVLGLVVLGGGLIAAGVVTLALARAMPARTMAGAMIRAMLAAYRRTLEKTMAQARSMQQVVDEAKLAWLETPDQAVVWGVALGLGAASRRSWRGRWPTSIAARAGGQPVVPDLVRAPIGSIVGGAAGAPGGSVFSGSAVPDFGGMFSVLGSIGNSPSLQGRRRLRRRGWFRRWRRRRRRLLSGRNRVRLRQAASPPYTAAMGAVETMETSSRAQRGRPRGGRGADGRTRRRCASTSVTACRRCAASNASAAGSCAASKGLRMIPGDVRDTGNTYEADILVVRPGAPSQHLDATFRVESGKITSINFAPR